MNFARADAADALGTVPEQKNIAPETFDGEVLVHFADEGFTRKLDDIVVSGIGNRAAVGDRGQARAAARPQHAVDTIAVNISAPPAAPGFHTFAKHFEDLFVLFFGEIFVWVSPANPLSQRFFTYSRLSAALICFLF